MLKLFIAIAARGPGWRGLIRNMMQMAVTGCLIAGRPAQLGSDDDGPPRAVKWPFRRRRLPFLRSEHETVCCITPHSRDDAGTARRGAGRRAQDPGGRLHDGEVERAWAAIRAGQPA